MKPERKPRGYVGADHMTIGSDILSVLATISEPERVLGGAMTHALRAVKPEGWYPIGLLLAAMERVSDKVGRFSLLEMGRKLFQMSHAKQFHARTVADLVYGLNAMYRHANRGTNIGGWEVTVFFPGYAELIKTTPHHCVMEEGILSEALMTLGVPAVVGQTACFREGADHCRYVIQSPVTDDKWMGGRPSFP